MTVLKIFLYDGNALVDFLEFPHNARKSVVKPVEEIFHIFGGFNFEFEGKRDLNLSLIFDFDSGRK